MDGHRACVDGCDACRGEHDMVLLCVLFHVLQEGGLSGTGLSCEEDVAVCLLYDEACYIEFSVL